MTNPWAAELPAGSRISSRMDGEEFVIIIPSGGRGRLPVGWTAAVSFLAVTFTAQGFLLHKTGWSLAGFAMMLVAGLMFLRNAAQRLRRSVKIILRMKPDAFLMETGTSDMPLHRRWDRADIGRICADGADLNLFLTSARPPLKLATRLEPAEAKWVAEQLQKYLNQ